MNGSQNIRSGSVSGNTRNEHMFSALPSRVAYKNHALGRSRLAASQRPLAGSNKTSVHELVTLEVQDVHLARFGFWDASCALLHIERNHGARENHKAAGADRRR